MSGYAKLASTLVLSTVWREPHTVRIVWITMLALADATGYVAASLPGLADAARVELSECEEALRCFLSPDRYSRSKAHEGRRIAEVDGGWVLLNYEVYRGGRDPETRRRQNREAQARHRDAQPVSHGQPRSATGKPESAHADADADADADAEQERDPSDRRSGLDIVPAATDRDFKLQPETAKPQSQRDADVHWVFEAWKHDTGHHKSKIDNKRAAKISARLRDGFTREQLRDAIRNRCNDNFLMGQNADGRVYDGIPTLLRDRDQVERLLRLTTPPTPKQQHHGGGQRAGDGLARQMQRVRDLRAAEQREQLALPGKVLS